MFLPNSHMQYLVKSSSHSSSSNTSVFPSGKANQSLTPVSPASRSPFCHLSLLPGFLSGRSQFHQSPARSALSQVAPSSCTLCESNASHCKRRNDMLLFLATCSEHLMLEKYNFTCIYLVGKSMLRCSSDSRRTVQSPRSLEAKENTLWRRGGQWHVHAGVTPEPQGGGACSVHKVYVCVREICSIPQIQSFMKCEHTQKAKQSCLEKVGPPALTVPSAS